MPDGRLRNSSAYSTHPSTVANRKRVARMSPSERNRDRDVRVEYAAIWQLLQRVSKKQDYRRAARGIQRVMLENSVQALMNKRSADGKTMCQTDTAAMIDNHLKKESHFRNLARRSNGPDSIALPSLKGVALDPSPHATTPDTYIEIDEVESNMNAEGELDGEEIVLKQEDADFDRDLDARLQCSPAISAVSRIDTVAGKVATLTEKYTSLLARHSALQAAHSCLSDRVDALMRGMGILHPEPQTPTTTEQGDDVDAEGEDEENAYHNPNVSDANMALGMGGYAMYPFPGAQFPTVWQQNGQDQMAGEGYGDEAE